MKAGKNIVIAIDGFSSCGKSTLASALARHTGFMYVDTGAMYRATTLYFLRRKIDLADEEGLVWVMNNEIKIDFSLNGQQMIVWLNGEDVSQEIREMSISESVSKVSAIHSVREKLVALQKLIGKNKNIVMDGRDIGTTVFPYADLKIFMTASPTIRAERRFNELVEKGKSVTLLEVSKNLNSRDYTDTHRNESPLRKASDAVVLDNTHLTQLQQLNFVLDLMKNKALLHVV